MAKLLLVGPNTKMPVEYIGSVVAIYEDAQKIPAAEQKSIDSGIFQLITVADKTREQLDQEKLSILPLIKMSWYDSTTDTWKDIAEPPLLSARYSDGMFSHNYLLKAENDIVVNANKLSTVEK